MKTHRDIFPWAAFCVAALGVTGCGPRPGPSPEEETPAHATLPAAEVRADSPARPSAEPKKLTPIHDGTYSLPGMDCLVNDQGIRVKVLVTRRGVRCLDRAPGGVAKDPALAYFRPYFVFDVQPRRGEVQFYQVGTTPRRDSVLGWVPAAAVTRWPTRVGARYRRVPGERVPPLLVYATKEPLVELITKGLTRAAPIARAALSAERAFMPWPIVEVERVIHEGQPHELVRIDFLGEFPADTAPAVASGGRAPAYSTKELQRIQAGLRKLDLVIVLDVTGSMGPYIEAAKETVRDLTRRLRELDFRPEISLALVAYRDHDSASGFVTRHFDLEADYGRFLTQLAGLKAGEGGDTPEAVYDGIHDALVKSSWRGQGLSARVAVVIGDASADEPGDPQNPRNISRDQLVALARKWNVKLFGLPAGAREGNADRERLWQQLSDLAGRTGGECLPIADASAVVARVRDILRSESAVVQQRAVVVEDLAAGKAPAAIAAERDLDLRKVTEVMEFLRGAGVDVGRLAPGVPAFASGWALCEHNGVPILEREVYLARAELDVLLGALNLLCSKLSPEFARQAFGLSLGGRVNPLASFFEGDVPEPLDVYLMARGVPVGRASLLRLSAAEVRHMPEERRAALRERISRTIIPALVNARNDDSLWSYRDGLEFGWVPERLLP